MILVDAGQNAIHPTMVPSRKYRGLVLSTRWPVIPPRNLFDIGGGQAPTMSRNAVRPTRS
jgi:hypothetical protein